MEIIVKDIDEDTGTVELSFGADEGFTVEYDDRAATIRFGIYGHEAKELREALADIPEETPS